ncbi:MAG: glycosyltransferase family 4 protein [Gammaproteobacteria bacterium]|nr:glycosyltransferase family 4 protein [Gammaproteobacteria bacterium]MCP4090701.1 glycosyltransferase family 4 protein [Gammaproteobacteria bacterium]MCP4277128.1 glycosyltransferase family 4 protein [Gammaproteobacteria bacterium]MCP4832684.1 glycosyltransferase family 4 protein [Gammaproteobacteria bacterium]MCP4928062.1 glycosyltransferase family 4 protein [Gammaproteobacteria bacterium]
MNILILAGSRGSINQLRPEYESFIGLARHGHNITVIIKPDSAYVPRLREAGIRMLDCYPERKICLGSIRAIRKELQSVHYDIIYATTSKTIPNAAFAAIGFPAKVVAYRGTTGGLYRHDPTAYLTILHPRVNGVICVSDAVHNEVIKKVWKNKEQVVTIYKGHNLHWYDAQPADLSEFGIKKTDFVLICAVNVRPSKGIDIMLEAANKLAHLDNLHLILAGKGMDGEPYSSMVATNAMHERIHVTGFRNDAPELIAASDILVQPSRSGEGLPRAVMESMGYGTPVVITDTGGGKEVVQDGKSGFVVPVEDPDAIAQRIEQLYNDPDLLESLSINSRRRLAEDFSSDRTVEKLINYFQKLAVT